MNPQTFFEALTGAWKFMLVQVYMDYNGIITLSILCLIAVRRRDTSQEHPHTALEDRNILQTRFYFLRPWPIL